MTIYIAGWRPAVDLHTKTKSRKDMDLRDWEINDNGEIGVVVWQRGYESQTRLDNEISKIVEWTEQQKFDEWFLDMNDKDGYAFFFKRRSDAFKFKLVWG